MSDSRYCEINDYIFEAPNEARKVKFQKLFSKVKGDNVLDLGCGYAGIYWALSYFERVNHIYFYDYYQENIDELNLIIDQLTPEYIEENFSETIEYLKEINLIEETKSYTQIAEELLSKIKTVKQQSFFDELPISTFDVVISSEAIECVDNETEFNRVLRNVYSSLKRSGTLIGNSLNYNIKTNLTEDLIASKMEGKLNPNEAELQRSLLNNLFNDIQIEVIEFPELTNRSKNIYYSGVKMNKYKELFKSFEYVGHTYLDSASTTQKPKVVIDSIQEHLSNLNVNPGRGSYDPAAKLEKEIEKIRGKTAEFINAERNEIVFTSGATNGLNTVAYSWGLHNLKDGDEVLICEEDHESTVRPWFQIQKLLKKQGINILIKYYKHQPYLGNADIESIKSEVSAKTRLIVVTHIHNVHGTISDIKTVRKAVGEDVLISLDACQSISHTQIDVKDLDVDFLVFSGHKMFALDSIGVLFVKKNIHQFLQPFIVGGGSIFDKHDDNENKKIEIYKILEAGTRNVTGIKSLEAAMKFIETIGIKQIYEYINTLTLYLYNKLTEIDNIEFLAGYAFDQSRIGYGLIAFRVHGVSSTDIGGLLNLNKIYVRTGNHCISNGKHTSDSIRVSMHIYNSKEDIDKLIAVLANIFQKL